MLTTPPSLPISSLKGILESEVNFPGKIYIYTCGVTVHKFCHVGHARMWISFDVVIRWLIELGYIVFLVRNTTDSDEKVFLKANTNPNWMYWTCGMVKRLELESKELLVLRPDIEPTSTSYTQQILRAIRKLIKVKSAYLTQEGNVYFKVLTSSSGGLKTHHYFIDKRNSADFALWKGSTVKGLKWLSPYGLGKPGWHIECSVMSSKCFKTGVDLHGGGEDLKVPHHFNEETQNTSLVHPGFVKGWVHNGLVLMGGTKMSNSFINSIEVQGLLKCFHPEVIRFYFLCVNFTSPLHFNQRKIPEFQKVLFKIYQSIPRASVHHEFCVDWSEKNAKRFKESMNMNINTSRAISDALVLLKEANRKRSTTLFRQFKSLMNILGLTGSSFIEFNDLDTSHHTFEWRVFVDLKVLERQRARTRKNYFGSDFIRSVLRKIGASIVDYHGLSFTSFISCA
jgi:cysteinyl-tRNA synthetase